MRILISYLLRSNEIPQYMMHMTSLGHVINKALMKGYGGSN